MSGSVQASDRLMKELREIYRSQSYKTGNFSSITALTSICLFQTCVFQRSIFTVMAVPLDSFCPIQVFRIKHGKKSVTFIYSCTIKLTNSVTFLLAFDLN